MDPNATLKGIRRCVNYLMTQIDLRLRLDTEHVEDLVELVHALDESLSFKGGALPNAWNQQTKERRVSDAVDYYTFTFQGQITVHGENREEAELAAKQQLDQVLEDYGTLEEA